MPNGFSHLYQLDEFISNFRVIRWYFRLYSNCKRILCKQTLETLIRCRILRRLILVCIVCICPIKRTLGLYGLNKMLVIMAGTHKMHIRIGLGKRDRSSLNWVITVCLGFFEPTIMFKSLMLIALRCCYFSSMLLLPCMWCVCVGGGGGGGGCTWFCDIVLCPF